MDVITLAAAIAAVKKIPDGAVVRAEQAAVRAEEAAELAQEHGYGLKIENNGLVITEKSEVNG